MYRCKRTLLAIAAFAALLPFAMAGVEAAAIASPVSDAAEGAGTPIDGAIDVALQQRMALSRLSASDQRIAREQLQMQFRSLSAADRQKVVAATVSLPGEDGPVRAMEMLNMLVQNEAREALAQVLGARPTSQGATQSITPKLGTGLPDLVFVATAGPCRVFDSRFGPGQLAGGASRQIFAWSNFAGYSWATGDNQGGTGTAGAGNCAGTVFTTLPSPVATVATVTVTNTFANGALRAWDGGATLSGGAVVNWNAGDTLSNTTVIQVDRTIAAFPGSGFKRDLGVNNNSFAPIDIVVDVIGYFIANTATALECNLILSGASTAIPTGTAATFSAPACPSGFETMMSRSAASTFGLHVVRLDPGSCRIGNFSGGSLSTFCDAICCRVPGR